MLCVLHCSIDIAEEDWIRASIVVPLGPQYSFGSGPYSPFSLISLYKDSKPVTQAELNEALLM